MLFLTTPSSASQSPKTYPPQLYTLAQSTATEAGSYIIQLQTHPIMNLIIRKLDMILIRRIPFLQHYLSPICSRLRSNHFLQLALSTQTMPPGLGRRRRPGTRGGGGSGYFEDFDSVV